MDGKQKSARKPLREVISDLDQEILRLLVRRSNLLNKIRVKGRLPVADEKFLREAWQADVARVSRDPDLSSRFFALMQQIAFLPQPSAGSGKEETLPGSQRRQAFNLAPPKRPAQINLVGPLSGFQTRAWLYLAALAGQPLSLAPCLQNEELKDFVNAFSEMGAPISMEGATLRYCGGSPLGAPDKVLHAGQSFFNFYIFLTHYLGRFSRIKITGDTRLQLADFSNLRNFLPKLGARLINIVPRSNGLPGRLESSGVLPAGVQAENGIAPEFFEALLLASPGYPAPFAVDFTDYLARDAVFPHILPILEKSGAIYSLSGATVSIEPSAPFIPKNPSLAVEAELAFFLLAFAFALGGEATIQGILPEWPEVTEFFSFCAANGFKSHNNTLAASYPEAARNFTNPGISPEKEWQKAFFATLAACTCLNGGKAAIPPELVANEQISAFLRIAGIKPDGNGTLKKSDPYNGLAWTAPSPAWALALAVTACCRPAAQGWPLGNPKILNELWPQFWAFYNHLPDPVLEKQEPLHKPDKANRRRIITSAVAVPPALREEDWD